jgi:hypothetical protein
MEETHLIMLISEVIHLYMCKRNTDGQNCKASIKTSDTLSGAWHYNRNNYDIYYGFLFTIIVNSIIWGILSYIINKYYWKSQGLNDQKYLLQYAVLKIKKNKNNEADDIV